MENKDDEQVIYILMHSYGNAKQMIDSIIHNSPIFICKSKFSFTSSVLFMYTLN